MSIVNVLIKRRNMNLYFLIAKLQCLFLFIVQIHQIGLYVYIESALLIIYLTIHKIWCQIWWINSEMYVHTYMYTSRLRSIKTSTWMYISMEGHLLNVSEQGFSISFLVHSNIFYTRLSIYLIIKVLISYIAIHNNFLIITFKSLSKSRK